MGTIATQEYTKTVDEERERVQKHSEHPGKMFILAESSGIIVGLINFQSEARRRIAHKGEFGMSVRQAWRGKGVGKILLQTLLEWAKANPLIEKISLTVHVTNEIAINLYKQFGFQEEGRRVREIKMPDGNYIDQIMMYRFVE